LSLALCHALVLYLMAHKFSNFTDAYDYLETRWSVARGFQEDAYDKCDTAMDYADAGNWKYGIKFCAWAIKDTLSAFDNLLQNYSFNFDQAVYPECLYWASQEGGDAEEYELTAKKICEAWAKNSFEGRALTIAFIDRMRQLIWDEPFYVKWAARPED